MATDVVLWVVGALLTINLAVLGVLGRFIKQTYDVATDLDVMLNGTTREQQGFVAEVREDIRRLETSHRETRHQMASHGRMTEQTAYVARQLAEAVDDMDGHDVDLDRLESVEGRWRDGSHDSD